MRYTHKSNKKSLLALGGAVAGSGGEGQYAIVLTTFEVKVTTL